MFESKKLPISLDELKRQKDALWNLNTEIGTIIEMTQGVWEILGDKNYPTESILVKKVEILGHNLFKIEFVFPIYDMVTDDLPNEHVSIIQMQLSIVQGLFMSIGLAIKENGLSSPLSYETFLLNRGEVLYRRDERTMRKKLKFNEKCYLIFKPREFIKKGNIYSLVTDIIKDKDTFLDGYVECVVQDQYLFDKEKKKYKDTRSTEDILPQIMVGNVLTRFEANENIKETISMTDMHENQNQDLGPVKENHEHQENQKTHG